MKRATNVIRSQEHMECPSVCEAHDPSLMMSAFRGLEAILASRFWPGSHQMAVYRQARTYKQDMLYSGWPDPWSGRAGVSMTRSRILSR